MTRRTFLMAVGRLGGSSALYAAMQAMNLLPQPTRKSFTLSGSGKGRRILILGAGLAGMGAAYELGKLGYDCHILEARTRAGGRCHTIRRGTVEADLDGHRQVAAFDEGLYYNPGPARIPQHHVTLDYCRELGVPIEMFGNANESAYYYNDRVGALAGKRVRIREARADLYGYCAELLAKAVRQSDLDKDLSAADRQNLLVYLLEIGELGGDLAYRVKGQVDPEFSSGDRRGYAVLPGAGLHPGVPSTPFDRSAILQAGYGEYFYGEGQLNWEMNMFQIVGGTDNLAKGFERRLPGRITFGAEVKEIRKQTPGVRVVYKEGSGAVHEATGDYCICAIPLSVLKTIPSDFSPKMQDAIRSIGYAPTTKVGLQFKRRFWEEDDRIFGGITYTDMTITQLWYPSTGFLGRKGVLVGAYSTGFHAYTMGRLSPADRLKRALDEGAKIHPQYPKEFETGFTLAWEKSPYSRGAWAEIGPSQRRGAYVTLNQPDGAIYLAGEHMTYMNGWMAGALESARAVSLAIHERASKEQTGKG